MTKTEAMKELATNGSEQTRKTYRRHGIKGKMYGVSYAVLGKMKRKIKTDQQLAEGSGRRPTSTPAPWRR